MPSQREPRSGLPIDVRHDQERPELWLLRAMRRSFVSIGRVIQIRLDSRLGAAQPASDLGDRQIFLVAIVARELRRAAALTDPIVMCKLALRQGRAPGLRSFTS